MQAAKKGQARVVARARLMLLLGEQLITDEVAAVSELVKNSYDADATKVFVTFFHVSEPGEGRIIIKDNGHGMTLQTVLSSWLELGTLSKARGSDLKPRFSEVKKRVCLGEKGLGRLAVHKLGRLTELVTRRLDTRSETKLTLDWNAFEGGAFLEDIPVEWEETEPRVFVDPGFESGTQITISRLQRVWSQDMIARAQRSLMAMKSPFAELSDFDIIVKIEDRLAPDIPPLDMVSLLDTATYRFIGEVDSEGRISYRYKFHRPDFPELSREALRTRDIREPQHFSNDRKPVCGPFSLRFYAWDLAFQDQKAVFGQTEIYKEVIRPNTGVKVFRDGFRVLPYGNPDNDWLSMDLERVRRFELHLSRNQIIGVIDISSKTNPLLLDKSGREGLIDNYEFEDFYSLVKTALGSFEAERLPDRTKLKEVTGRTRDEKLDREIYSRNMALVSKIIQQQKLDGETRIQIEKLISETREALDSMLGERELPLLVAASIGLTYMMPTHEVRRDLLEAMKTLRHMRDSREIVPNQVESAISLLRQADSTVGGIGRLMQRTREEEPFELEKAAKNAVELMRYRMERNNIVYEMDLRSSRRVIGSDRLITILLLNLLDNSIYWLVRKKQGERKIKIVIDSYDSGSILVVSDSGPGFGDDDIETVTLPFFTRKPDGMGLGLYISDRIARTHGGRLKVVTEEDISGLLPGANIAVVFPEKSR